MTLGVYMVRWWCRTDVVLKLRVSAVEIFRSFVVQLVVCNGVLLVICLPTTVVVAF